MQHWETQWVCEQVSLPTQWYGKMSLLCSGTTSSPFKTVLLGCPVAKRTAANRDYESQFCEERRISNIVLENVVSKHWIYWMGVSGPSAVWI